MAKASHDSHPNLCTSIDSSPLNPDWTKPRPYKRMGKIVYKEEITEQEVIDTHAIWQLNKNISSSCWPLYLFGDDIVNKNRTTDQRNPLYSIGLLATMLGKYDKSISFGVTVACFEESIDLDAWKSIIDSQFQLISEYILAGHDVIVPANDEEVCHQLRGDAIQSDILKSEYIQTKLDDLQRLEPIATIATIPFELDIKSLIKANTKEEQHVITKEEQKEEQNELAILQQIVKDELKLGESAQTKYPAKLTAFLHHNTTLSSYDIFSVLAQLYRNPKFNGVYWMDQHIADIDLAILSNILNKPTADDDVMYVFQTIFLQLGIGLLRNDHIIHFMEAFFRLGVGFCFSFAKHYMNQWDFELGTIKDWDNLFKNAEEDGQSIQDLNRLRCNTETLCQKRWDAKMEQVWNEFEYTANLQDTLETPKTPSKTEDEKMLEDLSWTTTPINIKNKECHEMNTATTPLHETTTDNHAMKRLIEQQRQEIEQHKREIQQYQQYSIFNFNQFDAWFDSALKEQMSDNLLQRFKEENSIIIGIDRQKFRKKLNNMKTKKNKKNKQNRREHENDDVMMM
eukprot:77662_1